VKISVASVEGNNHAKNQLDASSRFDTINYLVIGAYRDVRVAWHSGRTSVSDRLANFSCPALDLQLMGGY